MKFLFAAAVTAFLSLTSFANADLVIKDPAVRTQMIRDAKVWLAPSWISSDFQFSSALNVEAGPETKGNLLLLLNDFVHCITTQADQDGSFGGKTAKFHCQLMGPNSDGTYSPLVKASGKPEKIKVKYNPAAAENSEIYGEILGTRLLWSLGFAADRMYFVKQTLCHGCTANPYKDRQVDTSSLNSPRVFSPTAIERKFSGEDVVYPVTEIEAGVRGEQREVTKIVEGVTFKEMMKNLPADDAAKYYQYRDRDALRLLAVFMTHKDIKGANQRLVCPEVDKATQRCVGQAVMMIQDIGTSFGVGVKSLHFYKVDLAKFSEPIWKNPATCQANLSTPFMADGSMNSPVISEIGRKFLAQLLQGFISGNEGRERVRGLFKAAHIDQRAGHNETVEQWTNAFIAKANQVIYPMGASNPNFVCPK